MYERIALGVAIVAVMIVGVAATGDAAAQVATTTTPEEGTTTAPESGGTAPSEEQTAEATKSSTGSNKAAKSSNDSNVRLSLSKSSPGNLILDSGKKARFAFTLTGSGRHDVTVRAIRVRKDRVVRHWKLEQVRSGRKQVVRWNGKRNRKGFAPEGKYTFKVFWTGQPGKDPISETARSRGKTRLNFHRYQFPIRAKHTYGDGFGAGRGHKGQDLFARCGRKIRAVRGGRVQYSGYHSAAGYYVVVDGRGTRWDYVYMHLLKRDRIRKEGKRLRTGDVIGHTGETGNASGCHLHFEMWSPTGWYEGGDPRPPTKHLRKWDRYS